MTKLQTKKANEVKIFDTTLRDGSQSSDVNIGLKDKVELVKALDNFGVDYIELGWPGSNQKDMEAFMEVQKLNLSASRIVAFGSTKRIGISAEKDSNLKAIIESGAKTACLFGKTWVEHITRQLKATKEQNLESIKDSISYLVKNNLEVIYDLEHFFDGFKDNKEYALECLKTAHSSGASTLVLCDTNGGTMPFEVREIILQIQDYFKKNSINARLGIHTHNDSGLAIANVLEAVKLGALHVQGTINGVGERIGNADLCQIIPNLKIKMGFALGKIDLSKMTELSNLVYTYTQIKPYNRQPFVGKYAFAHKGGVHVDAVMKGASYEHIDPALVGNKRNIVLSELSGRATVVEVAKKFGYELNKDSPKVKEMLSRVEEMEKRGYDIGTLHAEHLLLVDEFFGSGKSLFSVNNWKISSQHNGGELSACTMKGKVHEKSVEESATVEGGPVDAAYNSLQKMISIVYPQISRVKLENYKVMIAEDMGAKSSVRVYIEFSCEKEQWSTVGVNANILRASIEAMEKGFMYYLKRFCE